MLESLPAFIAATWVLAMVPGPSTMLILRESTRHGRRTALTVIAANEVGVLLWALVATFGLSAILLSASMAFDIVRIAGAVVLVVLGVRSLIPRKAAGDSAPPQHRAYNGFAAGLATILANPKAAIFAAAFLPQFVPAGAPVTATLLLLSLVWTIVDMSWYLLLLVILDRAHRVLQKISVRRWMERLSGVVLLGLAIRLIIPAAG